MKDVRGKPNEQLFPPLAPKINNNNNNNNNDNNDNNNNNNKHTFEQSRL